MENKKLILDCWTDQHSEDVKAIIDMIIRNINDGEKEFIQVKEKLEKNAAIKIDFNFNPDLYL